MALFIYMIAKSFNRIERAIAPGYEFEIGYKDLILFDNPSYKIQDRIPYSEMAKVSLAGGGKTITYLVIHLKPNSKIISNEEKYYNLNEGYHQNVLKKIFISLEYADINSSELIKLLDRKIQEFTAKKNTL